MALLDIISYAGGNDEIVTRSEIEDFNSKSQLIVNESQEALFYKDGKALDLFANVRPVKVKEKQVVERKLRNVAHAGEFAALGVCAVGVDLTFDLNKKKLLNMTFRGLAAFVFCVVYAVLDEVHQIFVEGRTFELKDIMNDSLGAIVGVVLFTLAVWALDTLIRKIKNKNAN